MKRKGRVRRKLSAACWLLLLADVWNPRFERDSSGFGCPASVKCSGYTEVMRFFLMPFSVLGLRSLTMQNCSLQAVLTLNAGSYLNIYLYVQVFCRSEPWNVIFALLGNEISFTWRHGYITAFLLSPCSIPACFQLPLLLGSPMTPSQCRHLPAICGPLMRHLVTRHRIFHLLKSHHLIHHKECGKEEKIFTI